jgi:hypothetical protein
MDWASGASGPQQLRRSRPAVERLRASPRHRSAQVGRPYARSAGIALPRYSLTGASVLQGPIGELDSRSAEALGEECLLGPR